MEIKFFCPLWGSADMDMGAFLDKAKNAGYDGVEMSLPLDETEYLKKLPNLRIGLDISHWCNVAESFLHDQTDAVKLAISRAEHIHARVGFPEGPQIPDPRVPEWQEALSIHQNWWKEVIAQKLGSGQELFTITPEFGPYPYMTILPFTQQPITSQWEINVYMMNHLRSVFNA